MIIKLDNSKILFGRYVQEFCKNKYSGYRDGCSNYNKKKGCPPCELIDEILDLKKDVFLIYTEFEVGKFAERMKKAHPNWSEKQCFNSRLWQGKARKEHRLEVEKFRKENSMEVISQPERKGVDINLLFSRMGIKLEWPPMKIARVVSMAGIKKNI